MVIRHRRGKSLRNLTIVTRLADQGLWSLGFFIFNVIASVSLSVSEFASLAVVTSISFVVIAVVRGAAVNARVVAGAQVGLTSKETVDPRNALWLSIIGALLSFLVIAAFIFPASAAPSLILMSVLGAILTLADIPRQLLIFGLEFKGSASLGLIYSGIAGASLLLRNYYPASFAPLIWSTTALVTLVTGWAIVRRKFSWSGVRLRSWSYSWRLAAESLYVGLAGQLAILLLFVVHDPAATAGFRLSYSLVFAPAFMLIQGLSPLYLIKLSSLYSRRCSLRNATGAWCGLILLMILTSGFGAWGLSQVIPTYIALQTALGFILPVGVSIFASQVLEAVLSSVRFSYPPVAMHRLRLSTVGIDIVCQFVAITAFGVGGLVVVLLVISALKIILGGRLLMTLHGSVQPVDGR